MKRWVAAIAVALMVIGSWALMGQNQAQALDLTYTLPSSSLLAVSERLNAADKKLIEIRDKIDLNNSDVRDFRRYRGFYPNLASKIIQNAPYEKPEDVLNIPGLTEKQKARLEANLDNFIVTPPSDVMNAGDDRYNPGVY